MQPKFQPLPETEEFLLAEDYSFLYDLYRKDGIFVKRRWRIPKGFISDGGSIPKIFWSIIYGPFNPRVLRASMVHDYFYYTHLISRAEADDLFYKMLLEDSANPHIAWIMWKAVSIFGKYFWPNTDEDLDKMKKMGIIFQKDE